MSSESCLYYLLQNDVTPEQKRILQSVAERCGKAEGLSVRCYASVFFANDAQIQAVNAEYRGIDQPTDVLSFPSVEYADGQTAGFQQNALLQNWDPEEGACSLGDIFISLDHARSQAREYGHSFDRELCYLAVHGTLHLMGYDHMEIREKEIMRNMEEKILSEAELSNTSDTALLLQAEKAMQFSYSPYSRFKVGACLLSESGKVYTGCNIENASYGGTICAERTALVKAVSEGDTHFTVLAIATEKELAWPCGICRQVLSEFAPHLRVLTKCGTRIEKSTLTELLPGFFSPATGTLEYLGKD